MVIMHMFEMEDFMFKTILGLLLTLTSLSALAQDNCSISIAVDKHSSNTSALVKVLNIRGYTIVESERYPEYFGKETCKTTYNDCSGSNSVPRCSGETYTNHSGSQRGSSSRGTYHRHNGNMSSCRPSYVSCQPGTTVVSCEFTIMKASGEVTSSTTAGGGKLGFLGGWKKYKEIPNCQSNI